MDPWEWTVGAPGVVEMPDGRLVRGRGLRHPLPEGPEPEFGVYLLGKEPPSLDWASLWVEWPDFRAPKRGREALSALRQAYERAEFERVEVACKGGIGRTGTGIAAMAVIAGIRPDEAVDWVRVNYDPKAVETRWQRRWLEQLRP